MADADKTCIICGQSCAGQPRVKNARGQYAHQACADAKAQAPGPGGDESDDLMAALIDQPAAAPPAAPAGMRKACPGCGNAMAEGSIVCMSCGYDTRTGRGGRTRVTETRQPSAIGGAMAAGGTFAAAGASYLLLATLGSVVGGLIGAGVWAGIIIATNFEVGYVAVGIGVLAGFGAAIGAGIARGDTGTMTGLIAVLVAIASICAGKYFAAVYLTNQAFALSGSWSLADMTESEQRDMALARFADEHLDALIEGGDLAEDVEDRYMGLLEDGEFPDDYPPEVVAVAEERWAGMSETERAEYLAMVEEEWRQFNGAFRGQIAQQGFMNSFGVLDAVFFLIAVGAAYKTGAGGDD